MQVGFGFSRWHRIEFFDENLMLVPRLRFGLELILSIYRSHNCAPKEPNCVYKDRARS